ncbi:MAG: DUF4058 family protein [Burkholderiales bacterium]|nr:DUF4058 family protein [Anaerolineae bacterium]
MSIYSEQNLYPGINAHVNSFLQNEAGGWKNFHSEHIVDIGRTINPQLPSGYFTRSEKSLQIDKFEPETGIDTHELIGPDVTIYQSRSHRLPKQPAPMASTKPTALLPLLETVSEEDSLTGLVIYRAVEGSATGRPVTRIELLSPANKPGGSHHIQYMVKRLDTLRSGLRLVEIDYLHQTPPIIYMLPRYSGGSPDAYPYMILVDDPRPALEEGTTTLYAFHTDDPLPIIDIPLEGEEIVRVDFGAAYSTTFTNSNFFYTLADYTQDPPAFDRYSEADRERIQKLLADIRHQQASGSEE